MSAPISRNSPSPGSPSDEVTQFDGAEALLEAWGRGLTPDPWLTVWWAFPTTRVIDIIKIPPARRLEHLPGGWGVVADDLLGSLYAAGLLHLLAYSFPSWFGLGGH